MATLTEIDKKDLHIDQIKSSETPPYANRTEWGERTREPDCQEPRPTGTRTCYGWSVKHGRALDSCKQILALND
jgi:hypothetical protein